MRLLNLGCGRTFHQAWVNVDLAPADSSVVKVDLRERLPFPDRHFDAVYHSHVLEHFRPADAERFLREGVRVLKPGGIMRVVVPDLEQIARAYLQKLSAAEAGDSSSELDHRWLMLELYDQTVRDQSGGDMRRYLQAERVDNLEFVRHRIGGDADSIRQPAPPSSLWQALRRRSPGDLARLARRQLTRSLVRVVGGKAALAQLDEGTFRHSGEVHQWMYDGLSLRRLMEQAGAGDVQRCDAHSSRIPDFSGYDLDAAAGTVRKPDSMFMEGARLPG